MSATFWRYLLLLLSLQTVRQFLTGLLFVAFLAVGLIVLGYSVRWAILPIFVAFLTCIGIGSDLRRVRLLSAIASSLIAGVVLSLIASLLMQAIEHALGRTGHDLPVFTALEIYPELFAIMILAVRWCVRSEVHKTFLRGTARYNEDDLEKRRQIIEAFKERERQ